MPAVKNAKKGEPKGSNTKTKFKQSIVVNYGYTFS